MIICLSSLYGYLTILGTWGLHLAMMLVLWLIIPPGDGVKPGLLTTEVQMYRLLIFAHGFIAVVRY